MAELKEDIKTASDWIVKAFEEDNLTLDYSIRSFIQVDKFFNQNIVNGKAKKKGRLSQNLGQVLFSIGAYVGETIIKTVPDSKWETNDSDPQGEINASVVFPNGTIIWPVQRVINRFRNGNEDSIYPYGHEITKEFTMEPFDESFWQLKNEDPKEETKPWWKFW